MNSELLGDETGYTKLVDYSAKMELSFVSLYKYVAVKFNVTLSVIVALRYWKSKKFSWFPRV